MKYFFKAGSRDVEAWQLPVFTDDNAPDITTLENVPQFVLDLVNNNQLVAHMDETGSYWQYTYPAGDSADPQMNTTLTTSDAGTWLILELESFPDQPTTPSPYVFLCASSYFSEAYVVIPE